MALKITSDTPLKVDRVYAEGGKVMRSSSIVGTKKQIEKIEQSKSPKQKFSSITKKSIKKKQTKILRKPTVKGPTPISTLKTLKSFAQESGPLVREVAPKELVKDERSLYFKKEYEKEGSKWLS